MMYVEEDAKARWCPFARVLEGEAPGAAGVNRSGPSASYNCVGATCMAWRIGELAKKKIQSTVPGGDTFWVDVAEAQYKGRPALETRDARGYCGLAGKP
jgi:hypothetical protein